MEVRIQARREQILEAALDVFSEKGFHKAKIEDIAQRAGIGKGTVYEYFSSKDQLFQEMLKEGMSQFSEALDLELKKEQTVRGRLIVFVRKNIEMGINHRSLARIAIMETAIIDDHFRRWLIEMHQDRIEQIEEIISEGIEQGQLKNVNTQIFARLLYGGLGVLMSPMMVITVTPDNIEAFTEEVVGYYLQGITA